MNMGSADIDAMSFFPAAYFGSIIFVEGIRTIHPRKYCIIRVINLDTMLDSVLRLKVNIIFFCADFGVPRYSQEQLMIDFLLP